MSAVRNVGEGVVGQIVAAREEGGPFVDFYDFCDRVDPSVLNKRTIESLVKAGGFDSLGHPRQGLVHVFETILDTVIDRRRNEAEGQFDLFSAVGESDVEAVVGHRVEIPDTEFPKAQRLAFEKEMLGLYVSEHPLMGAERSLRRHVDSTLSELREAREGELRTVGGIVTALATKYTRRGDFMATFVLEDLAGVLDVMVFPRTMTEYGHVLENDAIVVVKGRVDLRDDAPKLVAMEVIRPEIVLEGGPPVRIKVKLQRAQRRQGGAPQGHPRRAPGRQRRCTCTSRRPRRPPCSASATTSSSTPATASSPSSASSSAPTASPDSLAPLPARTVATTCASRRLRREAQHGEPEDLELVRPRTVGVERGSGRVVVPPVVLDHDPGVRDRRDRPEPSASRFGTGIGAPARGVPRRRALGGCEVRAHSRRDGTRDARRRGSRASPFARRRPRPSSDSGNTRQ